MTNDPYHNQTPPRDRPYPARPPGAPLGAPPAAPAADDLQFDRAESAAPPSPAALAGFQPAPSLIATACAVCNRPITDYYFEAGGKVLCPDCRQMIAASMTGGSGFARFLTATLFGVLAGLVGAAIWWAVAYFFRGLMSGLIAVVIGLMVGGAVRVGAERRGGIGYQLLAILITYLAVGAGLIAAELTSPARQTGEDSFTGLALVIVSVIGVFVGPVLTAIRSPIAGIIMAFALWEAWKMNKHNPIVFNGPYRIAPPGATEAGPALGYPPAPGYPAPGAPAYAPPPAPPGAWPPPPPTGAA